jgi:hypothetical protein
MNNDASNAASRKESALQPCPQITDDQTGRDHNRGGPFLLAVVRWDGAPSRLVTVRNVSSSGLMGEMDNPPRGVRVVEFRLGSLGWRGAGVVWTVAQRFGARFHEEIDPTALCGEAE